MPDFTQIVDAVAAATTPDAKAQALLERLAARIKATSNDQNVQKLARELTAAAPHLAKAFRLEAHA